MEEKKKCNRGDLFYMEEKKKSKKWLIITILILIIIVLIGVGGYFGYQIWQDNQTTGTEWGDIYFDFLQNTSNIIEEVSNEKKDPDHPKYKYGLPPEVDKNSVKAEFIDINEDDIPEMLLHYDMQNGNSVIHKFNIVNDEVEYGEIYSGEIKLLYNIEKEEYNYYLYHLENDNNYGCYTLKNDDEGNLYDQAFFTHDEEKNEFNKKYIEVEIEDNTFDVKPNMNKKELKKEVEQAIENYKDKDNIVTDEVKEKVQGKIEETKKAEEEKAQKEAEEKAKAEEEARKAAEEEVKKGLKVGNTIIKYGTYKGKYGAEGETLVIKADGTATLKVNNITDNYTYTVGKSNLTQDNRSYQTKETIILKKAGVNMADAITLYIGEDGNLWDDPLCYAYAGE